MTVCGFSPKVRWFQGLSLRLACRFVCAHGLESASGRIERRAGGIDAGPRWPCLSPWSQTPRRCGPPVHTETSSANSSRLGISHGGLHASGGAASDRCVERTPGHRCGRGDYACGRKRRGCGCRRGFCIGRHRPEGRQHRGRRFHADSNGGRPGHGRGLPRGSAGRRDAQHVPGRARGADSGGEPSRAAGRGRPRDGGRLGARRGEIRQARPAARSCPGHSSGGGRLSSKLRASPVSPAVRGTPFQICRVAADFSSRWAAVRARRDFPPAAVGSIVAPHRRPRAGRVLPRPDCHGSCRDDEILERPHLARRPCTLPGEASTTASRAIPGIHDSDRAPAEFRRRGTGRDAEYP